MIIMYKEQIYCVLYDFIINLQYRTTYLFDMYIMTLYEEYTIHIYSVNIVKGYLITEKKEKIIGKYNNKKLQ